jgi:GNAT superfamily N-acetyltransferase
MLPPDVRLGLMESAHFDQIIAICRRVYPLETPYTIEELSEHQSVYPQGQFVAVDETQNTVAGVHFTLRLRLLDFHIDDPWDVLTARGTFQDHNPYGHTLYGADIMVDPAYQRHGIAHVLTDQARQLVEAERLWRMVGASRLPGLGACLSQITADDYVKSVAQGERIDPVLSAHLRDGWSVVKPIYGYLPHDEESAGWAAVIQWLNPACPPPVELDLSRRFQSVG